MSTNPDLILAHMRLMAAEYRKASRDGDPTDRAAGFLALDFAELDDHLSAGGAPPEAWREGPDAPADDECDRCGAKDGRRIYVGHGPTHGFDGLCDPCLDAPADETTETNR